MAYRSLGRLPELKGTRQCLPKQASRKGLSCHAVNSYLTRPANPVRTDLHIHVQGMYYPSYGDYVLSNKDNFQMLGLSRQDAQLSTANGVQQQTRGSAISHDDSVHAPASLLLMEEVAPASPSLERLLSLEGHALQGLATNMEGTDGSSLPDLEAHHTTPVTVGLRDAQEGQDTALQSARLLVAEEPHHIPAILDESHRSTPISTPISTGVTSPEAEPLASLDEGECSIVYPGAQICTKVQVTESRDKADHVTYTFNVQGKLRPSQWNTEMPIEAIGFQAMEEALHNLSVQNKKLFLEESRWVDREPLERHHEVANILANGKIVEAVQNPTNQYGHESYKVKLKDRTTSRTIEALFKPRLEGDGDGWHRVPMEAAAYQLGMLLGIDTVPPAAVRTNIECDWRHHPEGVFCYFAENCRPLVEVPPANWGIDKMAFLSDTRILDVLIQNSDRHIGHFLFGRHWAQGRTEVHTGHWKGHERPILIDHSAGFRKEATVLMEHDNAFGTGPTEKVVDSTYMRLRCLTEELLTSKLGSLITHQEIMDVLRRRDTIIGYFDDLIRRRGFDHVVIKH